MREFLIHCAQSAIALLLFFALCVIVQFRRR
jgi:hypothetical protein